jgi:hypothetical protein
MAESYTNVTQLTDRHGKIRWRFRKTGLPPHYFISAFGTPEFDREWQGCFDGASQEAKTNGSLPAFVNDNACVYFIGADFGPVKIGFTGNLRRRLESIQNGYPERIRVLAYATGGRMLEASYHRRFASYRMNGEWFRRAPELEREIETLGTGLANLSGVDN